MAELTKKELISIIKRNGYSDIKEISDTRLAVLVTSSGLRKPSLMKIQNSLKKSEYEVKYRTTSNKDGVGHLLIEGKFDVTSIERKRIGSINIEMQNNLFLHNEIRESIEASFEKKINVVFAQGNTGHTIKNVTAVSQPTEASSSIKANIYLATEDSTIPISVKTDDITYWEDADWYWGQTARRFIDKVVDEEKCKIVREGGFYRIRPAIGIKANEKEKIQAVFGTDILKGNGIVIQRNFSRTDFVYDYKKNTLTIRVSNMLKAPTELQGASEIYFLIYNDIQHKSSQIGYPGIGVWAVSAKRASANVLKVDREILK